jgi:hypothetical protein
MKYKPSYDQSWALIIGINKYRHVSPLEIARADAESVRDALVGRLQFPAKNVELLLDTKASRARIMEKFLGYESLNSDDRLIVFFAGHGTTVQTQKGAVGYLIPVDGDPKDKSTLIRWDDLTRNADIIPAKHVLFIMDACYSGLAIQRSSSAGERRFVTDMLQRRSRQVITAGKADETVADGGGPAGNNSIFTGYLLQGLEGEAAGDGGVITAANLMSYTYNKVARDSRSHQTPHFGHIDGDGDFILWMPTAADDKSKTKDFLVTTAGDRPEPPTQIDWNVSTYDFAQKAGYSDPDAVDFGKNEWSKRLAGSDWSSASGVQEPAFGWLALTVEPVSNEPLVMDLAKLASSLRGVRLDLEQENLQFKWPQFAMTTAKSLLLYDTDPGSQRPSDAFWNRYLRIDRGGALEYCDYAGIARRVRLQANDEKSYSVFLYVQLIGTIWTFLYAAKSVLGGAGYTAGVRFTVNLIGTKDSILADFAATPGKNGGWADPFDRGLFGVGDKLTKWRCQDTNLQFSFRVVLGSFTDADAKTIICDCAEQLGLAYNHQSPPRCFTYGTDEFPWPEFHAGR